jgi:hypothetical protein
MGEHDRCRAAPGEEAAGEEGAGAARHLDVVRLEARVVREAPRGRDGGRMDRVAGRTPREADDGGRNHHQHDEDRERGDGRCRQSTRRSGRICGVPPASAKNDRPLLVVAVARGCRWRPRAVSIRRRKPVPWAGKARAGPRRVTPVATPPKGQVPPSRGVLVFWSGGAPPFLSVCPRRGYADAARWGRDMRQRGTQFDWRWRA